MTAAAKNILYKLETLPENMVNEVEDFVDFLKAKHAKNNYESKPEHYVEEPMELYGAAKGLIVYIAEDFNEPLDEFKEYM